MRDKIIQILESLCYKGNYLTLIKKDQQLWNWIVQQTIHFTGLSEKEMIFMALHNEQTQYCSIGNKLRWKSIKEGYRYCDVWNKCECAYKQQQEKAKNTFSHKYGEGITNAGQLEITRQQHKKYIESDNFAASRIQMKETNLARYGVENVFQNKIIQDKAKKSIFDKFGVENVSQAQIIKDKKIQTTLEHYGVEYATRSPLIKEKTKQTNLERYGADSPLKNQDIKNKIKATRITHWQRTNASREATIFFKNYICGKYDISQVAFADEENNLFEWGYNYNGQWLLFDFVAFDVGSRGNINHIVEIIEYMGPFHYTVEEVNLSGESKAFPWKTKDITIKESFEKDQIKRKFCIDYKIELIEIWPEKYHKGKNVKTRII